MRGVTASEVVVLRSTLTWVNNLITSTLPKAAAACTGREPSSAAVELRAGRYLARGRWWLREEGIKRSADEASHVKKLGDVFEVSLGRQVQRGVAARHCGSDIATRLGKENDHFVEASKHGNADGGATVGKGVIGAGLRLRQQIFHSADVALPQSKFKPERLGDAWR
jgi:hypothetical protein